MPGTFRLTRIELRVAELSRSRAFYERQLGFHVAATGADRIDLSTTAGAPALLRLSPANTRRPQPNAAGLFHAALLLPSRSALASWLGFAAARAVSFQGFSDHGVSEAIYLADPDGNGLEFYADRPRSTWPSQAGELAMNTGPLDVRHLLADAAPTAQPLHDAVWGHLHLRVTDLDRSESFYREHLGLATTQRSYPGARFLAADGYHHHFGLNVWGLPRAPWSPDGPGLHRATIALPDRPARTLHDPDGIPLQIEALCA